MPSTGRIYRVGVVAALLLALVAAVTLNLAARNAAQEKQNAPTAGTSTVRFEDVTKAAGIHFIHNNGATGKKWLPETMGPGVAFIDYDNDGWQDLLLVNGMDWPGQTRKHTHSGAVSQQPRTAHSPT